MKYILLLALIFGAYSQTANEKQVWKHLRGAGLTKAGAAGMMGNLKAESGIQSVIYENAYKSKIGLTDKQYVDRVNSGKYSEHTFVHDAVGFGLAQWTYYTRKQALYNKCKGKIGDMGCQLDYLVAELKMYFSGINKLLRSSNELWTCTVRVLKEFENPADSGSSVQNYRYSLAKKYYDMFS